MTKPMWQRGDPIRSPAEALSRIEANQPIYFNHKWTHPGWSRSWPINLLISSCRAGRIFEAIPREEPTQ
jgi:hypothetical protein